MSQRKGEAWHQLPTEVVRAVTRGIDAMAEAVPALLTLADGPMSRLQIDFEKALSRALHPPKPTGRPKAVAPGHGRPSPRSL